MNSTAQTELSHEQRMRLNALEFACSMYANSDGHAKDKTAEGFIAFANEVYKFIKDGNFTKDDDIQF